MRNVNGAALGLVLLLTLILSSGVVAWQARGRVQPRAAEGPAREEKLKERLNRLPITDYDTDLPSDPQERARRLAKGKSYDDPYGQKIDPSSKVVHIASRNQDWELGLESALPTAQSSAIIVGEVVGSTAHLSEGKTNVYSEFTVRVEEVIKNDGAEPITVGDSILTERPGGRIRTPSGHVQSYTISGQGTPEAGRRYVLFLGYNPREALRRNLKGPRGMSRHILTAFELRAGRVLPLDNAGGRNFQQYAGLEESTFLHRLRLTTTPQ